MPVVTDRAVAAGRYELRDQLAVSATATVWRANDRRRKRDVCVKLLHPQLLGDQAARRRIIAEASAAGRLNHPNIVAPLDSHFDGATAALVFPLIEGETLGDRLERDEQLPPPEAARVAAELADALACAHEHGVVHRDVTPGNVMLAADGKVFLLDFGIAATAEQAALQLTEAGTTLGTLPYMAPEHLAGGAAQPANDVWALGAVLYEMLAGNRAYEAPTAVALATAHRHPPADIPDAPPPLVALAMLALASDPAQRPTAADFARSLRAWLTGQPNAATAVVPINATAVIPVSAAAAAGATWRPGRRGVISGLAAAGLAVAVVAAFTTAPQGPGAASGEPDSWRNYGMLPLPTPTPAPTPTPKVVVVKEATKAKAKPKKKHNTGKHKTGKHKGRGR